MANDLENINSLRVKATIKPGWRIRFLPGGRAIMVHKDQTPRLIDLNTVKDGDELPRWFDEGLGFSEGIKGH